MKKKYTAKEVRNLILDTASVLFIEKGYEQTSISDVVTGLDGLTRGAIYHHFESKHHIIVGIAKRFIPEQALLDSIDERDDLNGLEKIQTLLLESMFNEDITQSTVISLSLLKDPTFISIYNTQMCEVFVPIIEKYIHAGNADGSIQVPQPAQMAEIVILLTSTWFIQALFPNTVELFFEKLKAAQYVLKESGVHVISDAVLTTIVQKLTEATM
ncbi:TetR/AcrR family transcriptional regulator [Paenibacillus sp. FSL R7-0331]|uniref:TetR/AcrR family transcriptional regulator n=1 Tax=Paenibacillus sp. FSL R7-0331 TaxID=1536773 RepID=UPI0004F6E315|nr:TetR/AcrR family transcriptional regulator [Paenibacillus sp. FSL R7-0331]AIQ55465.1 TetR family transcriptional regulator [Paenibacillus sp. FSL R7-0331]